MSGESRRKRWRRRSSYVEDGAAEGGCCLIEVAGAASCLALLGIIPLLMR